MGISRDILGESWKYLRSINPLVHWSVGPLVRWFIGPLVHWFVGPLVRWSISPLVHWSIGPLFECQMLYVNKVKLLSERTSGVLPFILLRDRLPGVSHL